MTKFQVGQPFPMAVPVQEGALLELWKSGLTVIIQMPGLNRQERKAFQKSFKKYAYYESLPVIIWVLCFPDPFGPVDLNFNARIVEPDLIDWFLDNSEEGIKNALHIYLLDGSILMAIKTIGLDLDAVKLFQDGIRKQLDMNYSRAEYDRALREVFLYSSADLYRLGVKFSK